MSTHVIADTATATTLQLVAQIRDKLLSAAEPFAAWMVEGERVNLESLRASTKTLQPAERLTTRLAHLKELLFWIDELSPPPDAETNRLWKELVSRREPAHRILHDQEHPQEDDRIVSITDPDGVNVDTYVPAPTKPEDGLFTSQDFQKTRNKVF